MAQLIGRFIDCLIPLSIGIFVLLYPQKLTKKDLSLKENHKLAKRLRLAGILTVTSGVLLLIASLLR
jgi:uncharacterized protein YjeT (DUF2065 family)